MLDAKSSISTIHLKTNWPSVQDIKQLTYGVQYQPLRTKESLASGEDSQI